MFPLVAINANNIRLDTLYFKILFQNSLCCLLLQIKCYLVFNFNIVNIHKICFSKIHLLVLENDTEYNHSQTSNFTSPFFKLSLKFF